MEITFQSSGLSSAITAMDARLETSRFSVAKPQKAFAVAFAVLATALAGCASGLGVNSYDKASAGVARVAEGAVVDIRPVAARPAGVQSADTQAGYAYTIRLPSGELVSVVQSGDYVIPNGMSVLIEYGDSARVIPQSGYSS